MKFDPIRPFVLLNLFDVVATLVGPLTLQIFAVAAAISNLAHNSSTINASLLKASLQNSPARKRGAKRFLKFIVDYLVSMAEA